jgi:hypothetical protein
MPTKALVDSILALSWPRKRATMREWQSIEFRIPKMKLHSYTAYRVVGAGLGG